MHLKKHTINIIDSFYKSFVVNRQFYLLSFLLFSSRFVKVASIAKESPRYKTENRVDLITCDKTSKAYFFFAAYACCKCEIVASRLRKWMASSARFTSLTCNEYNEPCIIPSDTVECKYSFCNVVYNSSKKKNFVSRVYKF